MNGVVVVCCLVSCYGSWVCAFFVFVYSALGVAALQVHEGAKKFCIGFRVAVIYGGAPRNL
jgi:hypothetical protein